MLGSRPGFDHPNERYSSYAVSGLKLMSGERVWVRGFLLTGPCGEIFELFLIEVHFTNPRRSGSPVRYRASSYHEPAIPPGSHRPCQGRPRRIVSRGLPSWLSRSGEAFG